MNAEQNLVAAQKAYQRAYGRYKQGTMDNLHFSFACQELAYAYFLRNQEYLLVTGYGTMCYTRALFWQNRSQEIRYSPEPKGGTI
jgi:hypothetical protein